MDFNKPQKDNDSNQNKKKLTEKKNQKLKSEIEKTSLEFRETEFNEENLEYFDYLIELPMFPHDFEHYKGNKKTTNEEINAWIEECIIALESDKSETYATAQTGDTKVIVLRVFDSEENYHYVIEVFRNRYTVEVFPEEL